MKFEIEYSKNLSCLTIDDFFCNQDGSFDKDSEDMKRDTRNVEMYGDEAGISKIVLFCSNDELKQLYKVIQNISVETGVKL